MVAGHERAREAGGGAAGAGANSGAASRKEAIPGTGRVTVINSSGNQIEVCLIGMVGIAIQAAGDATIVIAEGGATAAAGWHPQKW